MSVNTGGRCLRPVLAYGLPPRPPPTHNPSESRGPCAAASQRHAGPVRSAGPASFMPRRTGTAVVMARGTWASRPGKRCATFTGTKRYTQMNSLNLLIERTGPLPHWRLPHTDHQSVTCHGGLLAGGRRATCPPPKPLFPARRWIRSARLRFSGGRGTSHFCILIAKDGTRPECEPVQENDPHSTRRGGYACPDCTAGAGFRYALLSIMSSREIASASISSRIWL